MRAKSSERLLNFSAVDDLESSLWLFCSFLVPISHFKIFLNSESAHFARKAKNNGKRTRGN